MANSNKVAKTIYEWLQSESGQNALQHDNLHIQGYDSMLRTGKDIHNLQSAISNYAKACEQLKFGHAEVYEEANGARIVFKPTDASIRSKLTDEECPSLFIARTSDGFKVQNNMPTANSAVLVRGGNGQVGLASSLSVGIDTAAERLRSYTKGWQETFKNMGQLAGKIKSTTRISSESVTHLNPSIFSQHQRAEYEDTLAGLNTTTMALEGREILKGQVMTGFYSHSLFQAHKEKGTFSKNGAPRSEKQFTRQLQNIMEAARGASSFQEIDSFVRSHYGWIYENIWKGDLANLYKQVAGRMTQGGKKEGAPGIFSTQEPQLAFIDFENVGRKSKQNLQYLTQAKKFHYGQKGSHASGQTKLLTSWQKDLYKRNGMQSQLAKDIYYSGELTDADLRAAYTKLLEKNQKLLASGTLTPQQEKALRAKMAKQLQDVNKGFGKDASFMSESANKDYRGMVREDFLKGTVSQELIDSIIRKKLLKQITARNNSASPKNKLTEEAISSTVETELQKLKAPTADAKTKTQYKKYIKHILRDLYGLDTMAKIVGFDSNMTDDQGNAAIGRIKIREKIATRTFTGRGGATSDERSVISTIEDELLAYAFLEHGYSPKEVFKNGKNIGNGLRMHIAGQQSPISEKNIRSHIVKASEYVLNTAAERGIGNGEIEKAIEAAGLKGILKYDAETGGWLVDNNAATKKFFHKNNQGRNTNTPFNLLESIIEFGKQLQIYEQGDYFTKVGTGSNAQIIQNKAFAEARELHVSSPEMYQGLADQTHSGSKFTWIELSSLLGTIGEMESRGVSAAGIAPVRKFAENLQSQMAEKEGQYQTYVKNAQFLGKTWNRNSKLAKEELNTISTNTGSVVMIPMNELMGLSTNWERLNTGYGQGVKLTDDEYKKTLEGYLEEVRKKQYATKEVADWEKLGIMSPKDIQVGVDLGNDILRHRNEHGQLLTSGAVMFGLGSMGNPDALTGLYNPDEIASYNNRILQALQELYTEPGDRSHAQLVAGRKIYDLTQDIGESYFGNNGSIYRKYHTLEGDADSGYLLLSALNEGHSAEFTKRYGKQAPSMYISTQDAAAQLSRLSDSDLDELFKQAQGTGKANKSAKIQKILEYFDASRAGYTGATLTNNAMMRSPTIKFASDILGGRLAFSSDKSFVDHGSMRVNADLAASAHGDMDGDRVAFFNAFINGDLDGAQDALMDYYRSLQENQRQIRELEAKADKEALIKTKIASLGEHDPNIIDKLYKSAIPLSAVLSGKNVRKSTKINKITEQYLADPHFYDFAKSQGLIIDGVGGVINTGELSKINSVADLDKRHARSVAMNAGAKGAGIYGDLLFGVQKVLENNALAQSSAGLNPKGTFFGNFATNIAHTLYQEGINPKNTKLKFNKDGSAPPELQAIIDATMALAGQSRTWDSAEGLDYFLTQTDELGITKAENLFKGEIMANMNLNNLAQGDDQVDWLLEISQRALDDLLERYDESNPRVKRLQDNIKELQKIKTGKKTGLNAISRELAIAIITDKEMGVASYFNKGDGSFGQQLSERYKFLPGHTNPLALALRMASQQEFGDLEKSDPFIQRFIELQTQEAEASGKIASHYMQLKRAKGLADWTTSPSRQTKQIAYNPKYGEAADTREILKYADDFAKQDSEVEELLGHGKSIDELRSMPGFAKYFTAKDYLSRQFNISKDFKVALESTFGGTIAHAAAEYQSRSSDNLTVDDIQNLLRKNGIADLLRQRLEKLLGYKGDPINGPIKEFFVKNIHKGLTNARYVQNNIERNGGKFLGSEMALAGFTNPQDSNGQVALSNQVTDYLYTTVDRNGKTIVHIGDYKNTAGGKPTAANVLQVKDYAHSLQTLHADVQGYTDAQLYLNTAYEGAGNLIAQGWLKRLANAAAFDVREQGITDTDSAKYKRAYNRAYSSRRKDFDSLFTLLSQNQNLGWSGELVTHGDDNTISRHVVDLSNGILNEIFEKSYLNPHPGTEDIISPEDAERLFTNNPNVITKMDTEFAGTIEEYRKFYSKEFDELAKAAQGIAKLKAEIKQLQERNIAELREINPNQDVISSNNTIIEEKTKELNERAQPELDTIKQNLLDKQHVVNLDNEDIGVTKDFLQTVINENSDSTYANQLLEQEKYLRARRQYAPNIKHQRYLTEQIQAREFAIQSRYTSESQKADYETELESLRQELQNTIDNFAKINAILKETDGTWKVEDDGKRLEAYHFNENDKKRLSEDAQRQFNISEQQTQMQFYGQAYRMYKKQFDTDDKIWKLDQEISKAQESNDTDRIQLLQLERENLEQQKALYTTMAPDLQNYKGYNAEDEAKAKKKAELESQRARLQYQQKGQGDKGGGFLGIDMYMERWLERMLSGGLIMTSIRMIRKGLHDMVNEAKQLDKVMTNLRIVTKTSAADAKTMMSQYSEQAKILGTSLVEYTQAATEWSRQGYETAEVMDLVKSSTYLSKLGMLDATTAVKDLTSAMKGFKVEASESMSIVDKLTALDVKAATTAGDIAEGLAQFANLASLNGVSIDQASAYVATIADVTQMSGSSVGQAMKTIMSRYGNVKAGAYNQLNVESESEDTSQNLNDVERVLKKLNISIRDNNLEFKDFDEILDEIAIKWETLDSVSKKAIANAFAGKFDVCPNM